MLPKSSTCLHGYGYRKTPKVSLIGDGHNFASVINEQVNGGITSDLFVLSPGFNYTSGVVTFTGGHDEALGSVNLTSNGGWNPSHFPKEVQDF